MGRGGCRQPLAKRPCLEPPLSTAKSLLKTMYVTPVVQSYLFQSAASHCDRVGPVLEAGAASLREATDQPRTHGKPVAGQGGTHSPGPSPPLCPWRRQRHGPSWAGGFPYSPSPHLQPGRRGQNRREKRKKRSLLGLKSLGHGPLVAERQSLWDRLRCWKGSPHVGALALRGGVPHFRRTATPARVPIPEEGLLLPRQRGKSR